MEDYKGNERIRRHHRRLLSSSTHVRLDGRKSVLIADSPSMCQMRFNSWGPAYPSHEVAYIRKWEGPSKYVDAILLNEDYCSEPVVQTVKSFAPRYRKLRLSKAPGLHISSSDRAQRRVGVHYAISAQHLKLLLVGGLTAVLKTAALLLARTLFSDIWPSVQVVSLCTLSIDPLKLFVPKIENLGVARLQGLATPVLCLTVAQPIIRWGLPDAYRTASFWRRLLPIYLGYMKTKYQVRGRSRDDTNKLWAARHEWGGDRVHRLVLDLSGFYVKSAQILATKADFVPEPWIRRLSSHLDNTPPRPFLEVEKSIVQQLERSPRQAAILGNANGWVPLDAVFSHVEETCIAAASIAQVHGAELKDGTRVVVKVQHLGMDVVMKSDLRNIVWVAKFLEGQLPFDLSSVVREIQRTIPLEFDFEREMWFMTRIKENLERGGFRRIVCPEPIVDLCTSRLLVMERLDGIPFTRILHPHASDELKSRIPEVVTMVEYLVGAYGQMLLLDGVFHADPHAGNLLLLEEGRLGLIDFGQSKVLERGLRKKLAEMVLALCSSDDEQIALALHHLGMEFKDVDGGVVQASTLSVMARVLFDTCYVHEATVSPMADESILRRTPLTSFNQALWLVVRTMVILRGLCYGLNMDLSSCTLWHPYALSALEELKDDGGHED